MAVSNSTAQLGSFTLRRTLVFANWNSICNASNISITAGATVPVASAFTDVQVSNNVYFVCSNFMLESGGVMDLTAKGYAAVQVGLGRTAGYGPGAGGTSSGASHGGRGGNTVASAVHDATNAPVVVGDALRYIRMAIRPPARSLRMWLEVLAG